jgi:hypothetical protein
MPVQQSDILIDTQKVSIPASESESRAGFRFVIDSPVMTASRNVTASTIDKQLLQIDLAKFETIQLTALSLEVPKGVWVNGKCDDDDVTATVLGYYVSA